MYVNTLFHLHTLKSLHENHSEKLPLWKYNTNLGLYFEIIHVTTENIQVVL
jgi:hypothetical protein